MPSEGEVEKYVRLQKCTGFLGMPNQMMVASHGKRLDLEAKRKATDDPGKLVTPQELNAMHGGIDEEDESVYDTETERTEYPSERKPPAAGFG